MPGHIYRIPQYNNEERGKKKRNTIDDRPSEGLNEAREQQRINFNHKN